MDEMHKAILEYVKKEYLDEDSDTEIDVDSPLISSGIVDSFSMVSLKTFLEKKYKISIPDAKATPEAFDSVTRSRSWFASSRRLEGRAWQSAKRSAGSLQTEIDGIKEQGLLKEERFIHSPQASHIEVEFPPGRQAKRGRSTSAPTTTSASRAIRRSSRRRTRGSTHAATACPRSASSAEPRTSTATLEDEADRVPGHRGHDPLPLLHGRQCRRLRGGSDRSGRDDLRPARACLDHRRDHASASRSARPSGTPTSTPTWAHLEEKLQEHQDARIRLIITDGVFSMDGDIAPLDKICRPGRASTTRWSSWTTRTPAASWARPGGARTSIAASSAGSTSSRRPSARRSAAHPAAA